MDQSTLNNTVREDERERVVPDLEMLMGIIVDQPPDQDNTQ